MPRDYHAQQDLPALNAASTRYAPSSKLFDPTRIPTAGPLILKEEPLATARALITKGLNTIQTNKEKRVTQVLKVATGLDS